jgi:inhibitor of KinA sporulation pathway (predicted exonuclease)
MILKSDFLFVIDFEFTCWRGRPPKGMVQEILEIGIVEIDLKKQKIIKKDKYLIKPEFSNISKFCTNLTGITKEDIGNKGVLLFKAFELINGKYDLKNNYWGSWGDYDKKHLIKECEFKNISFPFSSKYINLQKEFSEYHSKSRMYSVENALKLINLEFEGKVHDAYCDAYNTAKIYLSII